MEFIILKSDTKSQKYFYAFQQDHVGSRKQIYQILIQQIHWEMKEGSEQQKLHIKFNKNALQKNSIYSLHEAQLGEKKAYVKVFNQSNITKYNLDEVLEFNASILNECFGELTYQENFLQIQQTYQEEDTFFYATKPYECRLDLFLKKKGPRTEKDALEIFEDILKASFSLIMAGFYHRNLRAQHFVKVDNKWKLESIVESAYSLLAFSSPDSEYLYNCKHQPPQAYTRDENHPFSQEEMDEWIVWDLGCILIHLLLGHHQLKGQNILQKFKDQPFSFQKTGAKFVGQKLSSQLKTLLGQMCHYNQQKRISFQNLIRNGFFSKQLASKLPVNEQPPAKKIFLPKSGSVSQTLSINSVRSDKRGIVSNQAKVISKQLKDLDKREHDISVSKSNKIETVQEFQTKISEIVENQAGQMGSSIVTVVHKQKKIKKESSLQTRPSLHEITDEQYNDIINVFKNYIDKVEILGIGGQKFKEILNIFDNKKQAEELINLTLYAVSFYKSMELYRLAKSMNENKPLFKFQQSKWYSFIDTRHYKALKKMVNVKQTDTLKQKLKKTNNSFVRSKQHLQKFVMKSKPDQVKFDDIKQAYRSILKISYDEVASLYTHKKSNQLASLGMYITFCLAIDKFYIVEEFKKNFDFFFNWSKKRPTDYVSLEEFQKYLDEAPRSILVENSRYIIKRFYQV